MTVRTEMPGGGLARLVIDRPEKSNALNAETVAALTDAARTLALDEDLRVVVLASEGDRAFSAGADVTELASLDSETAYAFIDALRAAIQAVQDIPVPVICRLQGACIGGAMELAAGCDLRVASENAVFCMPEVRVGIPSVIQAALLPRLMGRGRAGWLVLSGDTIDARTAERWGFVERCVAADALDGAVDDAVQSILACAPAAVRTQKRLNREWDDVALKDAIDRSMDTFATAYAGDEPRQYLARVLDKKSR